MNKKEKSHEGTIQVINGAQESVAKGVEFMNDVKKEMDLFYESNAPSIVIEVDEYKIGYENIRKRGGKIRVITEITKENINYCKELLKIVDELRHLDNVKGGIAVSESAYMTTTVLQSAKPLTQVVYSDVLEAVYQQQNFFNSLWERAIPAIQKIREITNELDNKQIDVFSALDNKIRRNTMYYLKEENMKASQIVKRLGITLQAFQKHFTKLDKAKIIEKNSGGVIKLTEIGNALTKQLPSIQFLSNNTKFFEVHSLSFLPSKFIERIGELEEFEIINEVNSNIENFEKFMESSKQIKLVNVPFFINENNEKILNIQKDVKIECVFDNKFKISNWWMNLMSQLKDKKHEREITIRKTKNIPIIMYVSENSAGIVFPDKKGKIDFTYLLFSRNKLFIDWCNDLFYHIMKNAHG